MSTTDEGFCTSVIGLEFPQDFTVQLGQLNLPCWVCVSLNQHIFNLISYSSKITLISDPSWLGNVGIQSYANQQLWLSLLTRLDPSKQSKIVFVEKR